MFDRDYQVCTRCVMDTTDPKIRFDKDGVCDHCIGFERDVRPKWFPDARGTEIFRRKVEAIQRQSRGVEYDTIMGFSGGLDSSYLLHTAVKTFGLKPLVFHVDGGWNSDIAVSNIQALVDGLGLDLFVEVIEWEEMRDFQLAFFKSGTPHLDIPQDHAFFATMFHFARKHGINHILNGGNFSTEGVRNPKDWLYYGTDMAFIGDLRRRFSSNPMPTYPWSGILYHKLYLRYVRGVEVVRPLNWIRYVKKEAEVMLSETYGWRPYQQKHFESRFTKFYEGYWLPTRFGYDTRRPQFSSLILTGQMTREEAVRELEQPPYPLDDAARDFSFVADKLGISEDELKHYHTMPKKWFRDYRNQEWMFDLGAKVLQFMGLEGAVKR